MIKSRIHRILLIRIKYLGEVVLTTPVIKNLRTHFPEAEICLLTREGYAPIMEDNPDLSRTILMSSRDKASGFIKQVRACEFDLVIDLSNTWRTGLLARLSGARYRAGAHKGIARLFYNRLRRPDKAQQDVVDDYLSFLAPLGCETERHDTQVLLTEKEREWAQFYLLSGGIVPEKPLVAIHPGSRLESRVWPFERFVTLVAALHAQGLQVVFIQGGPDEGPMLQRLMDQVPNEVICADNMPVRRLGSLLAQANVLVSSYSGLMHLGAAVGTKIIGIFGPDAPEYWFPYPQKAGHQAIFAEVQCRPCQELECPLGTLECMQQVTVETVVAAVNESMSADVTR